MGAGEAVRYAVCIPDFDETAWHEVESSDADDAGAKWATELCSRDPECYSSFDGDGLVVLVRGGGCTVPVRVSVEMVPSFTARRVR